MSFNFVPLTEAENYDVVGTIALWEKETSRGDAFLGGVIQIGGRDGSKLNVALFPNDQGKAALKGSITSKVGDKYIKLAWVSVYRSDSGQEAYYGYVNPNTKESGTENLSFTFKLYRKHENVSETRPDFKGEVQFLKKEEPKKPVEEKKAATNVFQGMKF